MWKVLKKQKLTYQYPINMELEGAARNEREEMFPKVTMITQVNEN